MRRGPFYAVLGELTVGHMFVRGGERPETKKVKGGLLGADYRLENGRYRIAKVYDGENWNPGLQAPLTQPGVNVKAQHLQHPKRPRVFDLGRVAHVPSVVLALASKQ